MDHWSLHANNANIFYFYFCQLKSLISNIRGMFCKVKEQLSPWKRDDAFQSSNQASRKPCMFYFEYNDGLSL